ncbi:MAG: hypothetical protein WCF95_03445 [bacterium]
MTVNFSGIKNVSGMVGKIPDEANKITWDFMAVNMHVDGDDFKKVQTFLPDFKETDTLHIHHINNPADPIYSSTISINGVAEANGIMNGKFFKPFVDLLNKLVKSEDAAVKPDSEFIKNGLLKKDIFGSVEQAGDLSDEAVVKEFANPQNVKTLAKQIAEDIRINANIDLGDWFKLATNEDIVGNPKVTSNLLN